jgi:6,7-dimethyl-8-ribityllumazine synthase
MNDAGARIPDVQGRAIVVIALIITGNTRNFQDVSSLQRLREHMTGL